MAISAGNYIIRSALDENIVLLTSAGSTAKNAVITAGALTETDNRCYWKVAIYNTSYNKLYNLNTGTAAGYMGAQSVANGKGVVQKKEIASMSYWLMTSSGNTMVVDGQSVGTYFISPYTLQTLYVTVPDNGGDLYLTTQLDDTTPQEFYFQPTTYVNTSLPTPNVMRVHTGNPYIIGSGSMNIYPQWKCSSTNPIYEMRYRSRQYNMAGIGGSWSDWSSWTMIQATKQMADGKYSGIMRSNTAIATPGVDNSTYSQADIQISVRSTSATTAAGYNQTGSVTHGAALTGTLRQWKKPTLTLSAVSGTQYGVSISYSSTYTIGGNQILISSIKKGSTELLGARYYFTNQDYQGDVTVGWNELAEIPANGDSLTVKAELTEKNGIVTASATQTLTLAYDADAGLTFTPTYTLTNRMTVEAKISVYDDVSCYMKNTDLNGNEVWTPVEEIVSTNASYRLFEVIPPFGTAPTIKWVVWHTVGGSLQWGAKEDTLSSAYIMKTLSYVWNWIDDEMSPHAYIMKYRANEIVQPEDNITLAANEFLTTGRDYPIFRYNKSISRSLGVDGAILNGEADSYATKADAEKLATANHTVYRQPNGKWYHTALQTVAFTREMLYTKIQISQEAESR